MRKIKKVYGYVRVSTETQAEHGYGLDTQRNAIAKYCEANSLELVRVFADEGKSGAVSDDDDDLSGRAELQKLLTSLNDTVDTVIVMNTSRLWRNENAKVLICREIKRLKCHIVSVEQPRYDLYVKDPTEVLFNTLMEALDDYERAGINMRLSKGKTTKAKQGNKPSGRQPFGYEYGSNKKSTVVNAEQAKVVRNIFEMRKGGMSFRDIAAALNKRIHTKDKRAYIGNNEGRVWSMQSIKVVLNNTYYIGKITYAGETADGNHEPIIDIDTWNAVNN